MSKFELSIDTVMRNEGGYSNHPADPGGETKYGISKRSYPNVDIANLTLDGAKAIIKENYWRFDGIDSQAVATKLLDMAVNLGLRSAVRILQTCLMELGKGVVVDGIIGPATIATCNGSDTSQVLIELRTHQQAYYVQLVAQKPSLFPFLKGWLRRANQV